MIYITVAGNTFGIRTKKESQMAALLARNYTPFIGLLSGSGSHRPVFTVDIDRRIAIPLEEPLKTFDYDLADDRATLRIYPGRYLLSILNVASGKTFSIDCPIIDAEDDSVGFEFTSDLTIQGIAPPCHITDHLLIFAFSVACAAPGTLLIHASTVVYRNKAVMFLGESGTGKSTHSRIWLESVEGASLLNDDAPAVGIDAEGTVAAYGTPWSGKTPCYRNEHYPLAALVRIKRAPYNRIERLDTLRAFGALLPSCLPTLQQNEAMLDMVCRALSSIMESVPVYTLECLPNVEAARVACKEIFP